jgi:hypothetical protein
LVAELGCPASPAQTIANPSEPIWLSCAGKASSVGILRAHSPRKSRPSSKRVDRLLSWLDKVKQQRAKKPSTPNVHSVLFWPNVVFQVFMAYFFSTSTHLLKKSYLLYMVSN